MTRQQTDRTYLLMAVREDGDDQGGDYWLPVADPGSATPRLAADERALYYGTARVEGLAMAGGKWQPAWTLPSPAHIMISENRLAFVCREFVQGNTSFGFGGLGAAIALTSTAVDKARAARTRRGRAAVGQVRFEWLSNMILDKKQPQPTRLVKNPVPVIAVHLTTRDDAGRHVRLVLRQPDPEITAEMLAWHARVIAARRLNSPAAASLDDGALSELRKYADDPAGQPTPRGNLLWSLPDARQPTASALGS